MNGKKIEWGIIVVALFLIVLIAGSLRAQTVLVPDFRVDDQAAGEPSWGPAAQNLTGNRFSIAWRDRSMPAWEIYASIYDINGNVQRDDYQIDDATPGAFNCCSGSGGTTIDNNGNFFVTWGSSTDGFTFDGRVGKYLSNGDPSGASVNASELGVTGTQIIQLAKGASNNLIVSYGWAGGVYYRIFDNNLTPLTASVQVNQVQMASETGLGSDSSGNFMIAWLGTTLMYGRLYDSNGNPKGGEFPLESAASGGQDAKVVYNNAGNFIVVWWGASRYALGRVFDGDGNPLTGVFFLGPAVAEPNEWWGRPSVDADDNGNFIIVYEYSSDTTTKGIFGTILDSTGNVVEQFFPVSQPSSGLPTSTMFTDVAYIGWGRFAAVWRDGRNEPEGDIYASILRNDHWTAPQPVIPVASPIALAILAVALGWILKRKVSLVKNGYT